MIEFILAAVGVLFIAFLLSVTIQLIKIEKIVTRIVDIAEIKVRQLYEISEGPVPASKKQQQ